MKSAWARELYQVKGTSVETFGGSPGVAVIWSLHYECFGVRIRDSYKLEFCIEASTIIPTGEPT